MHLKMTSPFPINATCPPITELPDAVNISGIPLDINTYFTPAQEALYEPLVTCCSPRPVGLADGCYFWCEQPPAYPQLSGWLDCLHTHAPDGAGRRIVGEHEAGAASSQAGAPTKMAMVVLAVLVGSACTWV